MMKLKVFENLGDAVALYESLGDKVAPEMSMALNRAAHGVRTDVSRVIPTTRGIAKEEVKNWKIGRSKPETLEAFATIAGSRLGLENFNPDPGTFMGGRTSGGVVVKLFGKAHRFKHAFVGLKNTNPYRVLEREKGKNPKSRNKESRFRLKHLTAVAVPQMADDEDVVAIVSQRAGERFLKQFDHVMDRLIKEFS